MKIKDYEYLSGEGFDTAPVPAIILGIVKTMHKKGDPITEENINTILKHYKIDAPAGVVAKVVAAYQAKMADKDKTKDEGLSLSAFKDKFSSRNGAAIKGLDAALKLMSENGLKKEVVAIIAKTNANNMFTQHSDPKVRYDIQDGNTNTSNFQIQLGGSSLKVPRPKKGAGGTSVTAVLVSKDILKACDASKEISSYVGGEMERAHKSSFKLGKVIELTM